MPINPFSDKKDESYKLRGQFERKEQTKEGFREGSEKRSGLNEHEDIQSPTSLMRKLDNAIFGQVARRSNRKSWKVDMPQYNGKRN